jgi:hypothetical protein
MENKTWDTNEKDRETSSRTSFLESEEANKLMIIKIRGLRKLNVAVDRIQTIQIYREWTS